MKKKNYLLIIMVMLLYVFSGQDLFGQTPPPPDSIQNYIANTWKLVEIEVEGNSYVDSVSTDLKYSFNVNGQVTVTVNDTSGTIPYSFTNVAKTQLVINEGTAEQLVYNIDFIDSENFIYNVDFAINGTTYNYTFKFVKI